MLDEMLTGLSAEKHTVLPSVIANACALSNACTACVHEHEACRAPGAEYMTVCGAQDPKCDICMRGPGNELYNSCATCWHSNSVL